MEEEAGDEGGRRGEREGGFEDEGGVCVPVSF